MTTAARLVFVDVIAGHARQSPDAPCVRDDRGIYTYGQVWQAVGLVADRLHREGVRPGERVVTAMTASAPHLVTLLGIMAAGAVCVPLNTRLTAAEAVGFLVPVGPRMLLADPASADLTRAIASRLVCSYAVTDDAAADSLPARLGLPGQGTQRDALGGRHDAAAGRPGHGAQRDAAGGRDGVEAGLYGTHRDARVSLAPGDPAMIIGTGGTTGEPKGATWSHQGLWLYASSCQAQMEIRRNDVELYFSPFFHVALATTVFSVLYSGGCAWILPRFDERAVIEALATGTPTRLFGAPTALMRLLAAPGFAPELTKSVRRVLFGSASSAPGFPDLLRQGFPGAELITGYGATEFGAVARRRSWELDVAGDSAVGRAVAGAQIAVTGPDGQESPRGTVGAVRVRAPWQMLGYWGRPEENATVVSDGWICSGDLGWLDASGCLHLAGREKDMVISGGENVFPVEVESVLAQHPDVAQAAVFGVDDPLWGERVEAAVVAHDGALLAPEGLREHCRRHLAGYKVPRAFHIMDSLPLTAVMKVDKRRLREVTRDA